ncbi:MAG: hypothetical protein CMO44_07020 [Verrucomicrobiales bacterium]|nr:hypothetical protein [Verrucomicrobiales bacterium]
MAKIAVTGCDGFIGGTLCPRLERLGYKIDYWDIKREKDIKLFSTDAEVVIHLAAMTGVRNSIGNEEEYYRENVENTKHVQEVCHHYGKKLIYASSSSAIHWWKNAYAATKKMNEATAMPDQLGLRFSTVYGPRSRKDMFMTKLYYNRLEYVTDHTRDFIHVEDIVDAIIFFLDKDFKQLYSVYNIGSGKTTKLTDIVENLNMVWVKKMEGESFEVNNNEMDISPVLKLGWKPTREISDYLEKVKRKRVDDLF